MHFSPDLIICLLFVCCASIQLFYYLFFFARLANHIPVEEVSDNAKLPVSIIICALNEEANLKQNLPLLLEQVYLKNNKPNFEVLVVNDNSDDGTFYLLNQLQEQYAHLHVVHLTQEAKLISGKKFPLSMGIKEAKYEHLLLTDADCSPASAHWLARMVAGFSESKKIVLGYSPYKKYDGTLNKRIRFETFHTAVQYLSYALANMPYMGVGRNLAYKKELFNANKGFTSHHHVISGDDDLFINQVADSKNTVISIHPDAFTISEPKMTHEEWQMQKERHLSTGKYYKMKFQVLLGLYAISHLLFWLTFVASIIFWHYFIFVFLFFGIRMSAHWFILKKCCVVLQEEDLMNQIWKFDFWFLQYNIKNSPSIFLKNKTNWN